MLTYDLERREGLARYDYLYRCIKEDILSGRLTAGEKLPSKRALARHLETAVVTVENAYAQLLAEGYLRSEEKRGYFVCPVEVRPDRPPAEATQLRQTAPRRRWLLDLSSGGSGTEGFPFSVWARLMRRVITEEGERLLPSMPHSGALPLRQALARHIYQFRGIAADPEQIVVGAGTEYLYNLLVQLLGRDRVYGVEDPGYSKAGRVYALNGAKCVYLPVDGQGVDPVRAEESGADILHLSPNHQFPTGAVMPIARRQSLLRWAGEAPGRYLIEDDYDSEFRYTGRPIPTLQSIDDRGRVIYLNTFSQTISPSMRLGFLVLPPRLLERYRQELGFYACTVPALEQHVLARFIAGGHYERHLSRMRKEYRDRRSATISAFRASPLASHVTFSEEGAGLHFLLRLDTNRSDEELRRLTAEAGIRLSFLSEYAAVPDPRFAHTLVINYAGLSQSDLEEALQLLTDVLLPLLA